MTLIADVFPKLRTAKDVTEMCKRSRSRRPLDRQDGKRSLTLFKSARHHLNHLSFQKKMTLIAYVFPKFWTAKDVVT